jgi:hypothetical protein
VAPATGPVRWQAGPAARSAAAVIVLVEIGLPATMAAEPHTWWRPLLWSIGGLYMLDISRRMMTWRVIADSTGLHIRGPWRARHRPSADVTRAVHTPEGELIISCGAGAEDVRACAVY